MTKYIRQIHQIRQSWPNSQILYLACVFWQAKYGQVGYPWKDHAKCSSETLTLWQHDPTVKSYGQFLCEAPFVITMKNLKLLIKSTEMGRKGPRAKTKYFWNHWAKEHKLGICKIGFLKKARIRIPLMETTWQHFGTTWTTLGHHLGQLGGTAWHHLAPLGNCIVNIWAPLRHFMDNTWAQLGTILKEL